MPDPWPDRQVLLAIGVTCVLVIGLILATAGPIWRPAPELQWRETPKQPSKTLAI